MTNDWLIQQLDELSEKSEYQDRALLYEIKKLMAEIDERTMQLQGEIDGQSWNHLNWGNFLINNNDKNVHSDNYLLQ